MKLRRFTIAGSSSGPGRELLVVDRQDERRRARLLLRELRQVAVARHAQDLHPLLLDGLRQRADAEARGVLRAEVLVDDDDGKAKLHAVLLRPRRAAAEKGNGAPIVRPSARLCGRRRCESQPRNRADALRSRNRPAGGAPSSLVRRWRPRCAAAQREEPDAERRAQPPAPRQVLLGRHDRGQHEHPARGCRCRRRTSAASAPSSSRRRRRRGRGRGATPRARGARPCQRAVTNANGVWHCSRQRYLSALNWNAPAPGQHRRAERPSRGSRSARQRAARPTAAPRRPRARRGRTRTTRRRSPRPRAPTSRPASGRPATMRRNSASTGYVVGSIIAAIISTHAQRVQHRGHDDRRPAAPRGRARPAQRQVAPAAVRRDSGRRDCALHQPSAAQASARQRDEQRAEQQRATRRAGAEARRRGRPHRRAAARRDGAPRRCEATAGTRTCSAARCGPSGRGRCRASRSSPGTCGDLPTNTGAPGTVENTVSVSVVVAPLALLYGSSSA